ncbi:polycystic kidney disease protein 1-like 2 [Aplysia californica]|uniref:Polycystic kidney disease protein 1-like 2 n=1 Tax=Aplysia californica TaxID=6500 RepID=A0ABM0ZUW3_APLCA|nr:polycystic kidney disease protein 1-like 2 [Aplysia californica]
MRRNAGTNSRVFFILSGEEDETEVRMLSDTKRPILKRGMTNGFLMAVPESLGRINYMRVWHDNSGNGKFRSWFLNYIVVKDLQAETKQVFIANRWFAVEEDDGQVDRIIPLAGKEQLEDFSYQFKERSKKDLVDGHLWFSVIARPPGSRFSCVERVACCLCLLFMTMLANAMFYNVDTGDTSSASSSFNFGPFSMSPSQISIGFISTLIVFPVNFLLVFLFRKSRPRTIPESRIVLGRPVSGHRPGTAKLSQVKPEISCVSSPRLESSAGRSSPGSDSNSSLNKTRDNERLVKGSHPSASQGPPSPPDGTGEQGAVKKKLQLPWWCRPLAWVILVVTTAVAVAIVTFYGISFQDSTCKKWITSLIISFFTSVFITQPIKVILTAVFLSLIVKNPGEEDDEDVDERNTVNTDDDFLHPGGDAFAAARPKTIGYKPPNPKELERVRSKRIKEVKMWAVVREILFYCIFLWVLLVVSYRNRSAAHFHYKDTMVRTFIKSRDTDINFEKIQNTDEFWEWAKTGLINGLLAGSYYNNYPPLRLRAYINDKASRILGHAVMRQHRILPGGCQVPSYFKTMIPQCNTLYSLANQEDRNFEVGWERSPASKENPSNRSEYEWTSAETLNGYPYWGLLGVYSGGGYVAHLNGSKAAVLETVSRLEREKWVDRYTRTVFVEFTVYNPQVNLFSVNTFLAEFHSTNGVVPSYRFEPAMLLPYMNDAMVFQIVCEIAFVVFIVAFSFREVSKFLKHGRKYFTKFWNWVEIVIIAMSVAAIVIYFYRLHETNKLTKQFKASQGNDYIKFQYVGYWNEIFAYLIGIVVCFATIKFLRLLRFNRRVSMLSSTLRHSARNLFHFSIIFWIVFLAFCQLFFLTYMTVDEKYSSFIESLVASVLMMMGKFNIYVMILAEPVLTQIFVLLYVVSVTFIIVNMFISILNDTFTTVRNDLTKQNNEYEILEFMMSRFKKWTGLGVTPSTLNPRTTMGVQGYLNDDMNSDLEVEESEGPGSEKQRYLRDINRRMSLHMQHFPGRIDKLLQSLSALYRDNEDGSAGLPQPWTKHPYMAPSAPSDRRSRMPPLPRSDSGMSHRRVSLVKVDTR